MTLKEIKTNRNIFLKKTLKVYKYVGLFQKQQIVITVKLAPSALMYSRLLHLQSRCCYVRINSVESASLLFLFDNREPLKFLDPSAYTGKRELTIIPRMKSENMKDWCNVDVLT